MLQEFSSILVFDEAVARKLGFGGYTVGIPHERIGGPPIWHIDTIYFLSVAIFSGDIKTTPPS